MFSFIKSLFGETRSAEFVSKSSKAAAEAVVQPPPALSALVPCPPPPRSAISPLEPCLEIPLQPIVDRLDPALRSRMARPANRAEMLRLPVATALEQLPRGAVRIPFSQLRAGAGPGLFLGAAELDDSLVDVPLAEIVSRLNPAQLRRRTDQKHFALSEDVPAVFAPRGSPHAPPAVAPLSKPQINVGDELTSSRLMTETASGAPVSQERPRSSSLPLRPASPPGGNGLTAPVNSRPSTPQAPIPARSPSVAAKPAPDPFKVPLASLARNWPEPMRREIMAIHMSAWVNLPFSEVEAAMKRGKAAFSWKQIRLWLSPTPSIAVTEHDTVSVELPLPVLAPLFLTRLSGTAESRKLKAVEEIPNVFSARKPAEHPPAPAATAPVAGAEARNGSTPERLVRQPLQTKTHRPNEPVRLSSPLTAKTPAPSDAAGGSHLTPADLVRRACLLSGVAGAVLTTLDGLVIATQLPCQLSAETAAGLLPELYRRLAHYTRELKLGEPSHVELLMGATPLQIFKLNSAYFAILGKPAEPLPKLQLNALAGQMSQRINQG